MNHSTLTHYQEFQEILKSYHASDRAQQALRGLDLVVMVGPSSTGRNTVMRELLKEHDYYFEIISDTTRQPQVRDGKLEENGVQYFFRTEEEMLADLRAGEFLEAELIHSQQVSGISIRELQKAKNLHKVAICDVDIGGVHNILKIKPDTAVIMLLPPSFEEWQRRIASRGRMTEHETRNRLRTAETIFANGLQSPEFNFVVAEDVQHSAAIIDGIVHGKVNPYQGQAVGLIHQLQDALQQKLASNPV